MAGRRAGLSDLSYTAPSAGSPREDAQIDTSQFHSPTIPPNNWAEFAREVIARAVRRAPLDAIPAPAGEEVAHGGVFVTLRRDAALRGCVGTMEPRQPLVEAVRWAAKAAALQDRRFEPVSPTELDALSVSVSILSAPRRLQSVDELELGRHGILVRQGNRRGLFLPQVAIDHGFDRETFLSRCCREKAGLAGDAWRDPATEIFVFETAVETSAARR